MIFGPKSSQRRELFFVMFSNERKNKQKKNERTNEDRIVWVVVIAGRVSGLRDQSLDVLKPAPGITSGGGTTDPDPGGGTTISPVTKTGTKTSPQKTGCAVEASTRQHDTASMRRNVDASRCRCVDASTRRGVDASRRRRVDCQVPLPPGTPGAKLMDRTEGTRCGDSS